MSTSKPLPLANKLIAGFLVLIAVAFILSSYLLRGYDPDLRRLAQSHAFEEEAMAFEDKFMFKEAIQSYEKALDPKFKTSEGAGFFSIGGLRRCYLQLGEYDKARQYTNIQIKANEEKFSSNAKEVDALEFFAKTGSPEKVLDHIAFLSQASHKSVPPHGFETYEIAEILWLYDIIGDYDAGIKLVDSVFEYFKSKYLDYVRPRNSTEALQLKEKAELNNQNAYEYKIDREFLLIREAFEQDKAEGKKGCVGKKPGEVCLGRATKAIIQSDYFPW